jgi:hypothetical protein
MSRWWQSYGPPEPAHAIDQLPVVEAPSIADTDLRREAIERTRKLIEAMPDRR